MERRVIAEVSAETLRLQKLIEELSNGDQISYVDIEKKAQVKMDPDGKSKLRRAIKRAGRVSDCVPGWGIKMANERMVLPILSRKIVGIDRAVRRADKCHTTLQEQFFATLTPAEQKSVLFAGAVFGAIRIAANKGRKLYGKHRNGDNPPDQTMISIPLPK